MFIEDDWKEEARGRERKDEEFTSESWQRYIGTSDYYYVPLCDFESDGAVCL